MSSQNRLAPARSAQRISADLEALSQFREEHSPGWTRRAFSQPYIESRHWVAERMRDAGLHVERDAANNLIGTLPGQGPGPALATGSHTDTVEGGGRFDGIIGVLAGIEVVRALRDAGIRLRHELRVIDFFNEEPNQYGVSCVGSRALVGGLTAEQLALDDGAGETLADGIRKVGGDPERVLDLAWHRGDLAAFVELHIEQGPRLELSDLPLAVVTAIAGIDRYRLVFEGQPDHAGATPMDVRRDALCAAAEVVLEIERLAEGTDGVATTGRLQIEPNAANVVPGAAVATVELRDADRRRLDDRGRRLMAAARAAGESRGVQVTSEPLTTVDPVPADDTVQQVLAAAADRLGLPHEAMFSGAGHDAAHMAAIAPIGMLFVPSAGGRSHCPDEWTDLDQVAVGARVLAQALLDLDASGGDR
ncbi:MAG: hydantoinase/carbamoylase family amidase [Streptosporangiales bacterium]|nr:hydantoinase/carbamoylase family amidase [Streptosporangiales bacterium]